MSNTITCRDCGEKYDDHSEHECAEDRINGLEAKVRELEERIEALEEGTAGDG